MENVMRTVTETVILSKESKVRYATKGLGFSTVVFTKDVDFQLVTITYASKPFFGCRKAPESTGTLKVLKEQKYMDIDHILICDITGEYYFKVKGVCDA
jgi:hypothetical protein